MELINVAFSSLASLAALFLLTKLMGNRQMSQLTMFDYINGITIGSIAAEMATSLEDDLLKPLTAMVIYSVVVVLISVTSSKCAVIRWTIAYTDEQRQDLQKQPEKGKA